HLRPPSAPSAIHFTEQTASPGVAPDERSAGTELLALISGRRDFGTVAFGTEGGLFDAAGIPTVVCGPGSMEQGHKPDEFVSQEQLDGCDAMLARLADWLQNAD